jgi:DMSO/TMAO reductase YedYZ molybdopterin-dependent catalytic subunit
MTELPTYDVPDEVDPDDWALQVTGAVSRPLRVDETDLETFPVETITDDFACLEGWTATDLSWRGVRVRSVLERAIPTVDDGYVLARAMDGDYGCSFPLDRVSDALIAFGLDGEPLPPEHGGPARLVPTDDGADCWESVKWVSAMEVHQAEPSAEDTAEEIATARL